MLKQILGRGKAGDSSATPDARARSAEELRALVAAHGTWMYRFDLGHGVQTPLHDEYLDEVHRTRWRMLLPELRRRFDGRWGDVRVLDSACNEGWFAFEVAKLGAREVVGFDAREANIDKARLVKAQLEVDAVSFRVDDIFNVSPDRYGTFDLVLCLGLMYHLEDPMGALRRLRSVATGALVIDTEVARAGTTIEVERGPNVGVVATPDAFAVIAEPQFRWNPLNSVTGLSFVPNLSALTTMLRHAGFSDVALVAPGPDAESRYASGDRVIVVAHV
jgi:tRNA (mo5U34)-methyltransferase